MKTYRIPNSCNVTHLTLSVYAYVYVRRGMSIKNGSSPAEVQLPDFGTIGLVESRYRPRELGHRSRECFAGVDFLSLETVSLPGRQRSHDYNAIQRIDAESWGHTRGRRRVANPHRVRPARRRKKNTLPPPPSHRHLLWPALSPSIASWESRYTTCEQRRRLRSAQSR